MANLALGKLPIEKDQWIRAEEATDGSISKYDSYSGFAEATWPCNYTLDLEDRHIIKSIRILLWDGLGTNRITKDSRRYIFSLSASLDGKAYEPIYTNEKSGDNGWFIFNFAPELYVRYIRFHGIKNSRNTGFHIVEFEVHDSSPEKIESTNIHPLLIHVQPSISIEGNLANIVKEILSAKNPNIDEVKHSLREISDLKSESKESAQKITSLKNELQAQLTEFKESYIDPIGRQAEVFNQAGGFANDAKEFKKNSWFWLSGIALSSIAMIIALCTIFKGFCFEASCFENIKSINYNETCADCNRSILYLEIFKAIAYRVLIISFISFIIGICVKNYNSCMHNYTINKHKANSLGAALALIDKTSDGGRDQLITQAANAIFTHQPTSYNKKSPENISTSLIEKLTDKLK